MSKEFITAIISPLVPYPKLYNLLKPSLRELEDGELERGKRGRPSSAKKQRDKRDLRAARDGERQERATGER